MDLPFPNSCIWNTYTRFSPISSAITSIPFVSCIISFTQVPELHWIIWAQFPCYSVESFISLQ